MQSFGLCQQDSLGLERTEKKLKAKDVLPNMSRMQATERAKKCHLLSLVTLTFDLDFQTHPSEGPNTSSV